MFQHLLREESIKTGFEAGSREAALTELVAMLPAWGVSAHQKSELLEKLVDPAGDSVLVGEDVVLAVCTLSDLSFPLASLGIARQGVLFKGQGNDPAHFIFLMILPEHEDAQSQRNRFTHDIATFSKDKFLKERLKLAESPEEAYEIVLREGRQDQILLQYGI